MISVGRGNFWLTGSRNDGAQSLKFVSARQSAVANDGSDHFTCLSFLALKRNTEEERLFVYFVYFTKEQYLFLNRIVRGKKLKYNVLIHGITENDTEMVNID